MKVSWPKQAKVVEYDIVCLAGYVTNLHLFDRKHEKFHHFE